MRACHRKGHSRCMLSLCSVGVPLQLLACECEDQPLNRSHPQLTYLQHCCVSCRPCACGCGPTSTVSCFLLQSRAVIAQLVRRAMGAGYTALVVTGDRPVVGRREADIRNRYELAPRLGQGRVVSATGARIGHLPDGTYDLVSTCKLMVSTW